MLWKEVKSWAKDQGYKTDRQKIADQDNAYAYTWFKIDQPNMSGEATSVSKVAKAIYNHMTEDLHAEYQAKYIELQSMKDIIHDEPAGW